MGPRPSGHSGVEGCHVSPDPAAGHSERRRVGEVLGCDVNVDLGPCRAACHAHRQVVDLSFFAKVRTAGVPVVEGDAVDVSQAGVEQSQAPGLVGGEGGEQYGDGLSALDSGRGVHQPGEGAHGHGIHPGHNSALSGEGPGQELGQFWVLDGDAGEFFGALASPGMPGSGTTPVSRGQRSYPGLG